MGSCESCSQLYPQHLDRVWQIVGTMNENERILRGLQISCNVLISGSFSVGRNVRRLVLSLLKTDDQKVIKGIKEILPLISFVLAPSTHRH